MSDMMMTEFTVSEGSGPPAGIYRATFLGITKTDHPEYGAGARFDFKVKGGEHDGKTASRTTKPSPSAKNACGRIMAGLLGAPMKPGEKVSLAPLVGRDFTIVVGNAPNGTATRVEQVMPIA